MSTPSRRQFVAASAAGLSAASYLRAAGANDAIRVGVMGMGGRGTGLASIFGSQKNTTVAYVCDVDSTRLAKAAKTVETKAKQAPKAVTDFRTILDDKDVDAIVVATCNHWHAPAAILACAAGKHVYVEKPCSHTPREGELLVAAAEKHRRQVQMGNQRRSWPAIREAMRKLHDGAIGRVYLAEAWYGNSRGTIGKGVEGPPPDTLDYALWQGPAPRRPFKSNYLHYTWHWFWHWGNGELGNNGIHMLDLCRWGLNATFPIAVTSAGGKFRYPDDDQQTPDTHLVSFDLPDRQAITWHGFSRNTIPGGKNPDVTFYGETGSLSIFDGSYAITDLEDKETGRGDGARTDAAHIANLLAAIRGEAKLNSDMTEAHRSTLLCHLGNIAHRTGRKLVCDKTDGKIVNDPDAMKLWTREYEPGWEPKV